MATMVDGHSEKEKAETVKFPYKAVIRAIRKQSVDKIAKPLYDATRARLRSREMRKAGVAADHSLAEKKTPKKVSDHINIRGVYKWIDSVDPKDKKACKMLQAVHATAAARL